LQIIALDSKSVAFAAVTTSTFEVVTGPLFKLSFVTYLGLALGGTSFSPNPSVSVADRGGNKITSVSGGIITAYLYESPTGSEKLLPTSNLVATLTDGLATFKGMYINEVGYPYKLGFRANIEV